MLSPYDASLGPLTQPQPYVGPSAKEMRDKIKSVMDAKTGQFSLRDSGERAKFETGAQRDVETGKPRVSDVLEYLPLECLERTADQYIRGAKKYDKDNWKKGIPTSRYLSSALRHLYMYLTGDRVEDHLAAVVFNVFGIMWNEKQKPQYATT